MRLGKITNSEKAKIGLMNKKINDEFLKNFITYTEKKRYPDGLNLSKYDSEISEGPVYHEKGGFVYKVSPKKIIQNKFDTRGYPVDKEYLNILDLIWDKDKYEFYIPELYFLSSSDFHGAFTIIYRKDTFVPLLNIYNTSTYDAENDLYRRSINEHNNNIYKYFLDLEKYREDFDRKDYYAFRVCIGGTYSQTNINRSNYLGELGRGINLFLTAQSNTDLKPDQSTCNWGPRGDSLSYIIILKSLSYLSTVMSKEEFIEFLKDIMKTRNTPEMIFNRVLKEKGDALSKEDIKSLTNLYLSRF